MSNVEKKEPQFAYALLPVDGSVILIKRGETGYWPSPGMTPEAADEKNEIMGLSFNEREAMQMGSLFGWHVPGAKPYKEDGSPKYYKAESLVEQAATFNQRKKRA